VDVLQIKSMIAIHTSKPNQGVTIPPRLKPNKSSNRYDVTLGLGLGLLDKKVNVLLIDPMKLLNTFMAING
jgi:hypothetical protein